MDLAQDIATPDPFANFFHNVQTHGRIDRIVHVGSACAQRMRSHAQKPSIASCHEALRARSKFFNKFGPGQKVRLFEDPFIAALRADDLFEFFCRGTA
jgi:hypothetical protein